MDQIAHLIDQFNELHKGTPWLDETFQKKISVIDEHTAFVQPHGCHSVAQIIAHLTAWRSVLAIRITINENELMDTTADWRPNELLKLLGWAKIKADFYSTHAEIVELTARYSAIDLDLKIIKAHTLRFFLDGLVHHDAYHMGQIGLIISMIERDSIDR